MTRGHTCNVDKKAQTIDRCFLSPVGQRLIFIPSRLPGKCNQRLQDSLASQAPCFSTLGPMSMPYDACPEYVGFFKVFVSQFDRQVVNMIYQALAKSFSFILFNITVSPWDLYPPVAF